MVSALTEPPLEFGNRALRKEAYSAQIFNANNYVKTIKCFDLIDNARTIRKHDPEFWKVIKQETKDMLYALEGADERALAHVKKIINEEGQWTENQWMMRDTKS
jgi:hypothetical protein